jgi:hypothetical protein
MSASNGSAIPQENVAEGKGKGKATEPETQDVIMEGEDSSSEEEVDDVSCLP